MRHSLAFVGLSLSFVLGTSPAFAFEIPVNDGYVTDSIGLLKADEEAALEQTLTDYAKQTTNEIALVIVQSLEGRPIADAAFEIGNKWGVGSKENKNGIIMLFAYADKQMMMATSTGLEGALPDLVTQGIMQEDMLPHFREGNYAAGFTAGIESIQKHIGGEYTAERYETSDTGGIWPWLFFFGFIILNYLAALLGASKSWWLGGVFGGLFGIILTAFYGWWLSIPLLVIFGLIFDYIVSQRGGRGGRGGTGGWGGFGGGSGFSGGKSGGFGGFGGGGSFRGGGSSARW